MATLVDYNRFLTLSTLLLSDVHTLRLDRLIAALGNMKSIGQWNIWCSQNFFAGQIYCCVSRFHFIFPWYSEKCWQTICCISAAIQIKQMEATRHCRSVGERASEYELATHLECLSKWYQKIMCQAVFTKFSALPPCSRTVFTTAIEHRWISSTFSRIAWLGLACGRRLNSHSILTIGGELSI